MTCNCKWCTTIIGIVILVFLFWETAASTWIIAIAAILLIIHAFMCKNCGACANCGSSGAMPAKFSKPIKKKKK